MMDTRLITDIRVSVQYTPQLGTVSSVKTHKDDFGISRNDGPFGKVSADTGLFPEAFSDFYALTSIRKD